MDREMSLGAEVGEVEAGSPLAGNSKAEGLTWRPIPRGSAFSAPGDAHAQAKSATMRKKVARWISTYMAWSPIPMRTVFISALLLASVFVFTSFIGRTQLGTRPDQFNWWRQAPGPFLNFFTWALLLPLVNHWARKWPLKDHALSRAIPTHIGMGLVLCTLHEAFTNMLYILLLQAGNQLTWGPEVLHSTLLFLPAGIVQRFLEYWLLLLLLLIVESHRQVQEERNHVLRLQNELQTTQLLALKKQMQPHFLFNTLNTVSALMDVDRKNARTVLARLGNLLRATLDEERRETVPLYHEIEHISNYLGIETVRFKDRLQVKYDIPAECEQAMVPGMVLQPLVENSIKHGLNAAMDGVTVTISAHRDGNVLRIRVSDDGKGCADVNKALAKGGIGLRNIRERLSLLHGNQGSFQAASSAGNGFHALISIPYTVEGSNR
jgi:two-component sensor histidine kinase